jgi:hypothetical protein
MGNASVATELLIAPLNPVPLFLRMVEELDRLRQLDPRIEEAVRLAEERFTAVPEKDLTELVLPVLWASTRNIPICPPTTAPWRPAPSLLHGLDGMAVLGIVEHALATIYTTDALERLSIEAAQWSRTRTENGIRFDQLREETTQLQEGMSKARPERWVGVAVAAAAGAAVGAAVGYYAGRYYSERQHHHAQ